MIFMDFWACNEKNIEKIKKKRKKILFIIFITNDIL